MIAVSAIPSKVIATTSFLSSRRHAVMCWPCKGVVAHNWGDKLNPYLMEKLTGFRAYSKRDIYPIFDFPVHYWIGSHLEGACKDPAGVVFGAGFINSASRPSRHAREICAVRGWDSYEKLHSSGVECPPVVGDAALLMPLIYKPNMLPLKRLGVIAHYNERELSFFRNAASWRDVRFIDIMGPIEKVVDEIVSCQMIASSSLHGLICADAYGIPNTWLRASDLPLGDGFKFLDYFSSVGRKEKRPLKVDENTTQASLELQLKPNAISFDPKALLEACPLPPRKAVSGGVVASK